MEVHEHFDVGSPRERVYAELNDVGDIGHCIAGVRDVSVVDETHSIWTVEQRFGIISRTFELSAMITERRPPELIAFAAQGQDVVISGHVELEALDSARTRAEVVIQIDVSGPLAPLVDLFAKGPQEALIQQTLDNLKNRLGEAADRMPESADAPSPPRSRALSERLLAWIRGHGRGART